MSEDKLKQTQEFSGEVLELLRDKGLSYAEICVVLKAAAGTAEAIYSGEMMALTWTNILRKE